MALYDTLGELKDAVREECERARNPKFDAALGRMVAMAESRLWHGHAAPLASAPVRVKEMETSGTLALVAGVVALPATFLQAKRLHWAGSPETFPTFETPEGFFVHRGTATVGSPVVYTIDAGSLYVSPRVTGNITLHYYARPAALEDENDTNDVLTAHPMVYFNAVLIEAFAYTRNAEQMQRAFGQYVSLVGGVNRSDALARRAGMSPLVPRLPGWRR